MKKTGLHTPEFSHPRPAPTPKPAERASEYITISVAEYHCLTKAATLLEVILSAKSYHVEAAVETVRTTVDSMIIRAEAGAAE